MEGSTSTKRRIAQKLLMPLVAAGTSAAASYLMKKGPGFVEDTLLPRAREAAKGAGGLAEQLPEKARSAVSGSGELAEQLTQHARDVTGLGDGSEASGDGTRLSPEDLSRRSEERARHRAQRRRKATN
jgi:hypothetical protein